jgi:glutathione synthase/RimK-type ligase-like ATP-grasp enzyme
VYWEYLTFREEYHALEKLPSSIEVVNLYSRDISKVFVDEAFHQVFGYSTIIDPKTYFGKIVQKSDVNAAHDGAILEGPIQDTKEGSIYQVLIDNSYGENLVLDIRVPVVGKTLDFVYLKYRDISERFKNTTVKTEKKPIREVLSDEEIDLLDQFAETIELDFGEFDVLRDNDSKKIYVVDVNNTPQGPPASTPKQDGKEAILTIAHQLESAYLSA